MSFDLRPSGNTPQNKPTAEDYARQFFSARETAPEFDQAKADRLQRMSKINGIGRALNVLADIGGTAMGANVRQRTPDQITPTLFSRYQDMMDKYKSDTDSWKYRDFQKTLQNAQLGIQRADKEDAMDLARQKQLDWMKAKTADQNLNYAKWSKDWELKAGDSQERARHNKAMENAALIRANKTGQKAKKEDKPFMVVGVNGQDVPLTQGQFRQYLEEASKDEKFGDKDFKATMETFKDNPLEGQKNIVQRYYAYKKEQDALNARRAQQGTSIDSKPKATKTIDYSTLKF